MAAETKTVSNPFKEDYDTLIEMMVTLLADVGGCHEDLETAKKSGTDEEQNFHEEPTFVQSLPPSKEPASVSADKHLSPSATRCQSMLLWVNCPF